MTDLLLLLIMVLMVALLCAICAAIGFLVGLNNSRGKKKKIEPAPISEEIAREIERRKHEYNNFLNYDGNEQKDFTA